MRIDEHAQHAQAAVQFDETHSAHVSGEIVNLFRAFGRAFAGFFELQIRLDVFDLRKALIPFVEWLDVHRANVFMTFAQKFGHEMAADKSACTCD